MTGPVPDAVTLVGHFQANVGLGRAARGTHAALCAAGIPVTTVDLDDLVAGAAGGDAGTAPVTIFHTNPDQIHRALGSPHADRLLALADGRYTVGFWAWESQTSFPAAWLRTVPLFNEIWVPSRFTAAGLAPRLMLPVLDMGHVVSGGEASLTRAALSLPDGYLFLACFDELSNVTRKNPAGAIEAFRQAFAPEETRAALLIKGRHVSPPTRADIARRSAGYRTILHADGDLPEGHMASLLAACDSFVSLHRAEGFGLVVAEAMQLGKPVLSTGYSGTMDFTTPDNSLLVRYRLETLDQPDGYYPAGTTWAAPDVGHAARLMRLLATHPRLGRRLGARAAADIAAHCSAEAVGARMALRLRTIRANWRTPPSRSLKPA